MIILNFLKTINIQHTKYILSDMAKGKDEKTDLDEKRRSLIQESEKKKSEKNELSNEIAKLRKSGADASDKIDQGSVRTTLCFGFGWNFDIFSDL